MSKSKAHATEQNHKESQGDAAVVEELLNHQPESHALTAPSPNISCSDDLPDDYEAVMREIDQANQANISTGEIQVPRISLAHGTTKEIGQKVAGWEVGVFFDNMQREIISENIKPPWLIDKVDMNRVLPVHCLPIVPIMRMPSEFVQWPTNEERAAGISMFHWKTLDVKDPRVRAGLWPPKGTFKGEGAPPVTEHLNILCFVLNSEDFSLKTGLMLASFSKTSYKSGQRLVSSCMAQRASNLPFWGRVKWLYSEAKSKSGVTWQLIKATNGPQLNKNIIVQRDVWLECFQEARRLADPTPSPDVPGKTKGQLLQELYVNAAQFDTDSEPGWNDDLGSQNEAEEVVVGGNDPAF